MSGFKDQIGTWLLPWSSRSIRSKILFSVLLVFCIIYGSTLTYVYRQNQQELFRFTGKEALGTARLLAITLFRNYEINNDAREIQSYITGVKRGKKNIVEITVYDHKRRVISSTNEGKLFQKNITERFQGSVNNQATIRLARAPLLESQSDPDLLMYVTYPISPGLEVRSAASGMIEIKSDMREYLQQLSRIRSGAIVAGIFIIIFMTVAIVLITRTITKPIDKLYLGITRVDAGDLNVRVDVTTRDEIGSVTETFNKMTASLQESRIKMVQFAENLSKLNIRLRALNKSSRRFVPHQFLNLLDKRDITDVVLGDASLQDMTVLFADIRRFTALSSKLEASEVLEFLNSFLGHILPMIEENHGFVDKYIGDAIMALFPRQADDAIFAAIAIREKLNDLNQRNEQEQKVDLGIGINSGELILGTVGSNTRIDTTVIGNTVNIAARLEGLSKEIGLPIIFTEEVFRRCNDDTKTKLKIQNIGLKTIRGLDSKVQLYGLT